MEGLFTVVHLLFILAVIGIPGFLIGRVLWRVGSKPKS
jgi:hypothetical protein